MTDRWAQAEARFRQREAERRYRRDDRAWERSRRASAMPVADEPDRYDEPEEGWDPLEDDDTAVIPRYVDDDEGEYDDDFDDEPEPEPRPRSRRRAGARTAPARGGRAAARKAAREQEGGRRRLIWVAAAVLLVLVVGAGVYKLVNRYTPAEDFAGPAGAPVVVQVRSGDTASEVASTMAEAGIVASSAAFYEAAVQNEGMNALQPGYYAIPVHSPAADAVAALVTPSSRVGNVVVSEGRQLHDQHDVNTGARKEGIYTKIAAASCVGAEPERRCVTYEQLEQAGATTDLASLGVPEWAVESVRTVPDRARQLEGLIAAGSWDFDPSGSALDILRQLVTESADNYEATGLLESGRVNGLSPYETLIGASLVEREALPQDMSKVARVIVNRLEIDQPLQFDSTVNYALDKTEVATTDADRNQTTAWNTYAMPGLPATPISSPSIAALEAMEEPEPGIWLYFVTVDKEGTTLFTESYTEHLQNIELAMESGILDSGR
ncbi:endolytic transglycosylase MltG [Nocardia sp. NBC_01329]|uniref:endolytic transglycosylase MltG n=1 Tax=Nocardia sp. NBC_01329 TaxID=2903594 RepID=UPI002E13C120|nr:endolytic transglycosylase MltG [Nocardia sp. NBC_01329]